MFVPQFPYKGNQIILSSDRVTLHSKTDAIFLFGKLAVSLSSTKTINLDSVEGVHIYTPIIELGNKAQSLGEPVVLGTSLVTQMSLLVLQLQMAAQQLTSVSSEDLGGSMQKIRSAGEIIAKETGRLNGLLNPAISPLLSKVTYTR